MIVLALFKLIFLGDVIPHDFDKDVGIGSVDHSVSIIYDSVDNKFYSSDNAGAWSD